MEDKKPGRRLGVIERDRIKVLQKRIDWLTSRVAIREDRGEDAYFDEKELDAISWAKSVVEGMYEE